MSNLKKFEETLSSLDLEVNRLKAISKAYEKLEDLVASYDSIIAKLKENNATFVKIKDEQNKHLISIEENFKKIDKNIHHANLELNSTLEERLDAIRKDNKEFYRDLESTIKIKLDDNKSQIKQLIENERIQLKQIIETTSQSLERSLSSKIDEYSISSKKALNLNKWSIWILGILIIGLLSFFIYKG